MSDSFSNSDLQGSRSAALAENESPQEAERRADIAEDRFRLIVDSVKDYAIFMVGPDGRVQTWNEGARRIKGFEAEEILGRHISRFYSPEDVAAGRPGSLLARAIEEGRVEDEGWRVRKDGTRFWADVVITAIRDEAGNLRGFVKVTRDLTDRRKAEEERVRLAQTQEAVRLRDEFLSIAAHELRTPLTALQLQVQSVHARARSSAPELAEQINRVIRSTDRLTGLIESLLDVSRISSGRFSLNLDRVNLSVRVAEAVDRMREASHRARCEVVTHFEPGVEAKVDPLRFEQVVVNLLSNAIKYAAGSTVRISLAKDGEEALLEIADGGSGIPEHDLQRVFERFERAAPMRHFGGLGLGLYVTREIVEAHGGSVSACNGRDGGAVFTVRVPLNPPPGLRARAESPRDRPAPG